MKKITSICLLLVLLLMLAPAALAEEELATSGQCGDNATWTYDTENDVLTISGTGSTWDFYAYGADQAP